MALNLIPFYASLLEQPLTSVDDPRPKKATQSHVLVYGAIEAHSFGDKGCIASNKTIGEETGLSTSRVASIISELSGAGWVNVELNAQGQREGIQPLMTLAKSGNPPLPPVATPLAKRGNRGSSLGSSREKLHTSTLRDDNTESTPASLPASSSEGDGNKLVMDSAARAAHLRKVFDALATTLHPGQKILYTDTRRNKLRKRLESFKPSELIKAAKNLTSSDFHMGKNDQKTKYATYDFLIKNDEKVEEWLNKKPVSKPKSVF